MEPVDITEFCRQLVNDVEYRANLKIRFREGSLSDQMEKLVWHYAAGRPAEAARRVPPTNDFSDMSLEELASQVDDAMTELSTRKQKTQN